MEKRKLTVVEKLTEIRLTNEMLNMIYGVQDNLQKAPQDFLMLIIVSMIKVNKESEVRCEELQDGSEYTDEEHAANMATFFGSSLLLELLAQEVGRRNIDNISIN